MSDVQIRWKIGGFRQIRSAPGVRAELERAGGKVAARANGMLKAGHKGFVVASYQGRRAPQGRWQVKVIAATPYARRANAKHNVLLRAFDGGR